MTSSTSSSRGAVKLLLNIGLLGMIILTINQLLLALLPYPWGEIQFYDRFRSYLASEETYDTLFIGSSLMYRHINPTLFDEEMADSDALRSFNLGTQANFFPKTYLTFREILNNNPDDLKVIFFELIWSQEQPKKENWHTTGLTYWYDLETTQYLLRTLWQSDAAIEDKLLYSAVHAGSLVEKHLNFGSGIEMLSVFQSELERNRRDSKWQTRNGYLSLDTEGETKANGTDQEIAERRQNLLSNVESLSARTEASKLYYNDPTLWGTYNEVQLELINEMMDLAQEQDIKLVFVLPPRLDATYEYLLPLYYALPAAQRIEMVNPDEHPELYSLENSFDLSHLNNAGAIEYTRLLVRKFMALDN